MGEPALRLPTRDELGFARRSFDRGDPLYWHINADMIADPVLAQASREFARKLERERK